jgi:hypothetical protein
MIFSEAEARRQRNALYIDAYAKAWAEASPIERELATLAMKDRWTDADRARHAELTRLAAPALEQIPPKSPDFGDKDLLHDIDLARILFGEVIPLRRDAR